MIVSDVITTIQTEAGYVTNSLVLKSYDSLGLIYKWLTKLPEGTGAYRREIFISTSTSEDDLTTRTVIESIEVVPSG